MSREIEETVNSSGRECPYCGYEGHVESEDYSEDERIEECVECGKKYYAYESFSVDHHARPDCALNRLAHTFEPVKLRNGETLEFCQMCKNIKPA